MKATQSFLLCTVLASASLQAMACYTVYDSANRVAWQGEQAPVDMSLPLHEALAARFAPGSSMVFDSTTECPALITASRMAPARGGSVLITDQQTAQSMNMPYKPMMGGLALVQPRDARMRPGVTVLPAETYAEGRPATATMGNSAAPRKAITELRDPPRAVHPAR